MNCLEAQSKIMAFIENKLPDDELREFIKHVRSCKNCYEELDIYYTLIVGMKQLDESDIYLQILRMPWISILRKR